MSGDMNKVVLIGRLTKDIECKNTSSGSTIAEFSIANNQSYTGKSGKVEEVSYFDCTVFGKLAETIVKYLGKGSKIAVEGRLKQNRWEDQQGNKRSKVGIIVDNVQFLDSKGGQGNGQSQAEPSYPEPDNNPFSDDSIPF